MKLKVGISITVSCVVAGFVGAQSPSSSSPAAAAATGVPYSEHSVWDITLVKTKAGMDDDYLRSIAQTL
jgi:ammonia channel protein AmtB